uniref:Lcl domain-containing protein n=1 Tax=Reinekea sp. TaxID=1970455 RepID=UPI002A7EBAC8
MFSLKRNVRVTCIVLACSLSSLSTVSLADLPFDQTIVGTNNVGDDFEQLVGGSSRDLIQGLAGNNRLFGMPGDDQLEGGPNVDHLYGGNGSNLNSGNDYLIGGEGDDQLVGEDGDDTLEGGPGQDRLLGGTGNDLLYGGADTDFYFFSLGKDIIDDPDGAVDYIQFENTLIENISFHQDGNDLIVLADQDADNFVKIKDYFLAISGGVHIYSMPSGQFITSSSISALLTEFPTSGDPVDAVDLNLDDAIKGTSGEDFLLGGRAHDKLFGDRGNDILMGNAGDDTYVFAADSGTDRIFDTSGVNSLYFQSDISRAEVLGGMTRTSNGDLVFAIESKNTTVIVKSFFNVLNALDEIRFALGQPLTRDAIFQAMNQAVPTSTSPARQIQLGHNDSADLIQGSSTGDIIVTGGNNDTLKGRSGDDMLVGGPGDDLYVFNQDFGNSYVIDVDGDNTIQFDESVSYSDIGYSYSYSDNHLRIVNQNTQSKILIYDFLGRNPTVAKIQFLAVNYTIQTASLRSQILQQLGRPEPTLSIPISDILSGQGGTTDDGDSDNDGVLNAEDQCPLTEPDQVVNSLGCSPAQTDSDNDGVSDAIDQCPATEPTWIANLTGCAPEQLDADNDGVSDALDICFGTPENSLVNADGCDDADGDGVFLDSTLLNDQGSAYIRDNCPGTAPGDAVDAFGCADAQKDSDSDGVNDALDLCPNSHNGTADENGCTEHQRDTDGDSVVDSIDFCPNTGVLDDVDYRGCAVYQRDTDNDGVVDSEDPDIDGDGVANDLDAFPLNANESVDTDGDGIGNIADLDDDGDSYSDAQEQLAGTDSLVWQSNPWVLKSVKSFAPRTGEKLTEVTGDDGDLQQGAPLIFRRDDEQQVVKDLMTGLIWQDDESAKDLYTTICLNLDSAGITNWRLPTRLEMLSTIDYYSSKNNQPRIHYAFKNVAETGSLERNYEVASTGLLVSPYQATLGNQVDFANGRLAPGSSNWDQYQRCVSGPEQFRPEFVRVDPLDVSMDLTSKLMFEDGPQVITNHGSWQTAVSYCQELDFAGYDDWRLPNISESHRLLHEFDSKSTDRVLPTTFHYVPETSEGFAKYGHWWSANATYTYIPYTQTYYKNAPDSINGHWKFKYRDFGANTVGLAVNYYHQRMGGYGDSGYRCVRTFSQPNITLASIDDDLTQGDELEIQILSLTPADSPIVRYEWFNKTTGAIIGTEATLRSDGIIAGENRIQLTLWQENGIPYLYPEEIAVFVAGAPIAIIEGPTSFEVGDAVTFDGSNSQDNTGIRAYRWYPGPFSTMLLGEGPTLSAHDIYLGDNYYTLTSRQLILRLEVEDLDGVVRYADQTLDLTFVPPTIHLIAPETVEPGETFTLDASGSSDRNGVRSYRWFETSPGYLFRSYQPVLDYTAGDSGDIRLSLQVTDRTGTTAYKIVTVRVEQNKPTVVMTAPEAVNAGEQVVFDASDSTDEDGIAAYRWYRLTPSVELISDQPTYQFTATIAGAVSYRLEVEDTLGYIGSKEFELTIVNDTPVVAIEAPTAFAIGDAVIFDGSGSSDATGIRAYRWYQVTPTVKLLSEEAVYEFIATTAGNLSYKLEVEDLVGVVNSTEFDVSVGFRPTAVLPAYIEFYFDTPIQLDGSSSYVQQGAIAYEWYVDGQSVGVGAQRTVAPLNVGDYELSLLVLSDSGFEDAVSVNLSILANRSFQTCPNEVPSAWPHATPIHPSADIEWRGNKAELVHDIERAFNFARRQDPSIKSYLVLPTQAAWDALNIQEQGLYLVNAERTARGLNPYEAHSQDVVAIAQTYAQLILDNNQAIGHDNDGRPAIVRLMSNAYLADHIDFPFASESIASMTLDGNEPDAFPVIRAIFAWLYQDKSWFEDFDWATGPAWGHRDHLLQPSFAENSGLATGEGLVGFGFARGLYEPSVANPEQVGTVVVFNTIDQSGDWSAQQTGSVNIEAAEGCVIEHQLTVDPGAVELDRLKRLEIQPSSLFMTLGESRALAVTGFYTDGTSIDLTQEAEFSADKFSVVSVQQGYVTALQQGSAQLVARIGAIESNRLYVNIAEAYDSSALLNTDAANLIPYLPTNVTVDAFDPMALALYTGVVLDRDSLPVSDVTVSLLNRPDYGSVQTDYDGRFTLAAPAGTQTFNYEKTGHIVVQRRANGVSNDWTVLDEVMLLPFDSTETFIDFTTGEPQVHQSSLITDQFGSRRATVIFNGITTAKITSADGSERDVENFWLSATEFETPQSMPGALPAESAFTYCTELNVAGTRFNDVVTFDSDVVMYVDNFLGFDVGEIVPIGYFDRLDAQWVASSNGIIVRLLDTDQDGSVDGVDYNDDGIADDLNNSGATTDEALGLASYSAGDTLMWGAFNHFTPVDYNWAQSDAVSPEVAQTNISQEDTDNTEEICTASYVKPYQLSFHEDIPLAGTGMVLHYSSQRTADYQHEVNIQVSGDFVPASMLKMHAKLEIGGRVFEQEFVPGAHVEATFMWNGTDVTGTRMPGFASGTVSVGYEYSASYSSAGNAAQSAASLDDFPVAWATLGGFTTGVPTRESLIAWQTNGIRLKNTYPSQIAEGWSLSAVHEFDPQGKVYKGDGSVEDYPSQSLLLKTGITQSFTEFDDGYYQSGGNTIQYRINAEAVLVDQVTGLEWQFIDQPYRTASKLDAAAYCANQALPLAAGWRLPTTKEIAYSMEKSGKALGPYIYNMRLADTLWHENTANPHSREFPVLCVKGDKLNDTAIAQLKRNDDLDVVLDQATGLMWQDSYDNISQELNWSDAISYCANSSHAGYNDWRLPNINELLYALPNTVFAHQTELEIPAGGHWNPDVSFRQAYWSSTTHAQADPEAWAIESVSFNGPSFKKADALHLRCVRDDASAARMPYRFNNQGQLSSVVNLTTGETLIDYHYAQYNPNNPDRAQKALSAIVDSFGNSISIERDNDGKVTAIVGADGQRTQLDIDANNNLKQVIYEDSTAYRFNYQGSLMTEETEPNGNRFPHSFNAQGRVTQTTDSEGGQWDFYDTRSANENRYGYSTAEGNLYETVRTLLSTGAVQKTTTHENGLVSTQTVSRDQLQESISQCGVSVFIDKQPDPKTQQEIPSRITVTQPSGLTQVTNLSKSYGSNGADPMRFITTTEQNGAVTTTLVDGRLGITELTSAEGRTSRVVSNPSTGLVSEISASGLLNSQFEYDDRGRQTQVTTGARSTVFTYNDVLSNGQLTSVTTANNEQTQYEYDLLGRPTKVTYPDGHSTTTHYDANGNATTLVVPTLHDHDF